VPEVAVEPVALSVMFTGSMDQLALPPNPRWRAVNLGLNGADLLGGNFHLAAISSLRAAGNINDRSYRVAEVLPDLIVTWPPELAPLRVPLAEMVEPAPSVTLSLATISMTPFCSCDGIGLNQSALIDDLRVEGNGSGVGDQLARIIHRTLRQGDLGAKAPPIRARGHQDFFPGAKADVAARSGDGSVVINIVADEENRAGGTGVDLSVIDNAGGGRRGVKSQAPPPKTSKGTVRVVVMINPRH
jgi:hypothetical protein